MSPLLCAIALFLASSRAAAGGSWASVPVRSPPMLTDGGSGLFPWHYAEVLIGSPPQNQSLALSIFSTASFVYSPDCIFCPADGVFDPSLSTTWNGSNTPWEYSQATHRATSAKDTMGFGGVFQTEGTPLGVITYTSEDFVLRFSQGYLGLMVHPTNQTRNSGSLVWKLWSEGKLLNPVIGMNIGSHTNPRMSIGALDPNDYDGEINWVEVAPTDDVNALFSTIPVEALRGYQGNIIPNITYPAIAALDSVSKNIYIPPLAYSSYFLTESLIGPQEFINIYPSGGMSVACNHTVSNPNLDSAYVHFSVDINGVNYRVDNENMLRPKSIMSTNETCNTALQNSTITDGTPITLGLTFLRSVYLAYRFPTEDCPKAFYGFAFPKGSNRTSTEVAQKPRASPTLAAQCLNFAPAGSTPTPTQPIQFPEKTLESNVRAPFPGERTWKVYGQPGAPEVVLRGADGVPALKGKAENTDEGDGLF